MGGRHSYPEYLFVEYEIADDDWDRFMEECIIITNNLSDYIPVEIIRAAYKEHIGNTREVIYNLRNSEITSKLRERDVRISLDYRPTTYGITNRAYGIGIKLKWPKSKA